MKQRRTTAKRPFVVSATALALGCVTLSGVVWHVRAASVQGSASVTVVAPSAVSAQNDIVIRLNAPVVSANNFSVGTSSQANVQNALADLPPSKWSIDYFSVDQAGEGKWARGTGLRR